MADRYENNVVDLPATPQSGTFVGGWRDEFDPETGRIRLNPLKLGRIMRAADEGDSEALSEVFSAVEEDPHVQAVLGKRRRAVTARKLIISPAIEGDSRAEQAAEMCQRMVLGMEGEDGIDNWDDALFDATDAIGRGYAVQQIVWEDQGGLWWPRKLLHWPQRDTVVGDPFSGQIRSRSSEEIRVLTCDNPVRGDELEPFQWMVHISKSRSTALHKAALLRAVTWFYLFKHYSVKDWTIFAERYGIPLRIGKYPDHANEDEINAVVKAIRTIGKDGGAALPKGAEIELVEQGSGGSQIPHPMLAKFCNAEISKAILGNTLTTEVGSSGGNRSLGEVQKEGETDMTEQDASRLARTIRRDLLRPIVHFNLGPDVAVPKCVFERQKTEDLNDQMDRDVKAVNDLRLHVDPEQFYERYGLQPGPNGPSFESQPDTTLVPEPVTQPTE